MKRLIIVVLLLSTFGMVIPSQAQATSLSELLLRQAELQRQAAENKKKIEQKKNEASNLQSTIAELDDDIAYTQGRITNTEAQIATSREVLDELNGQIKQSNSELGSLNEKLRVAYVNLYEMSQTSPVESILASNSLADLVSQTQYIQAVQTELQASISKVNKIKTDLEGKKGEAEQQKSNLEALKTELSNSNRTLGSRRAQKDYLLDKTQGEQTKYEELLAQIQKQSSQISDEIYQERLRQGGFVNNGGTGGYPWAGSCGRVDSWLYYTCECTSYAAWKFLQIHGVPFRNARPGEGSAYNWPTLAADQGYTVSSSPRVGDAVSWNRPLFPGDQWGHVAIVETVYSSSDIVISEYNWKKYSYSERRINPSVHGTPRYIRP